MAGWSLWGVCSGARQLLCLNTDPLPPLQVLSKQAIWNGLLTHFKENGCLVEGECGVVVVVVAYLYMTGDGS